MSLHNERDVCRRINAARLDVLLRLVNWAATACIAVKQGSDDEITACMCLIPTDKRSKTSHRRRIICDPRRWLGCGSCRRRTDARYDGGVYDLRTSRCKRRRSVPTDNGPLIVTPWPPALIPSAWCDEKLTYSFSCVIKQRFRRYSIAYELF